MYCNKKIMVLYSNNVFSVSDMDNLGNHVLQNCCKILKNYFRDMLSVTRKANSRTLAHCHI